MSSRVRDLNKGINQLSNDNRNRGPQLNDWNLLFLSEIAKSLAVIADLMGAERYFAKANIEEEPDETDWKNPEFFKLGDRIRKRLDEIGMSQRELADKLGITEVSLSRYITGNRVPKATVVIGLAKVLDVSVDWLLKGEE